MILREETAREKRTAENGKKEWISVPRRRFGLVSAAVWIKSEEDKI